MIYIVRKWQNMCSFLRKYVPGRHLTGIVKPQKRVVNRLHGTNRTVMTSLTITDVVSSLGPGSLNLKKLVIRLVRLFL
jgi:hypothetical protein